MQNNDNNQEDDERTFIEKPPTIANMRNSLKFFERNVQHRSEK